MIPKRNINDFSDIVNAIAIDIYVWSVYVNVVHRLIELCRVFIDTILNNTCFSKYVGIFQESTINIILIIDKSLPYAMRYSNSIHDLLNLLCHCCIQKNASFYASYFPQNLV